MYTRKKPKHSRSSVYSGNCSLASGSMCVKAVDSKTPPPKQSRQDISKGCLCLALCDIHAGAMPATKLPRPKAIIEITFAVDTSILIDFVVFFWFSGF